MTDVATTTLLNQWAARVRSAERLTRKVIEAAAKGNRREALTLALQADEALNEASTLLDAATILTQHEKLARS